MYRESYGGCGAFGGRFRGHYPGSFAKHFRSMPVNIEEKDDSFKLYLFAPGLNKNNIKITSKDDVLTISYKASDSEDADGKKFTRREYNNSNFERSFLLNGKVDVSSISANYTDGILAVILPKDPEKNKPEQKVNVE